MFFSDTLNADCLSEGNIFILTENLDVILKWHTASRYCIITIFNGNYPLQGTFLHLFFFLMSISFLMPNEILRELVITFHNVSGFLIWNSYFHQLISILLSLVLCNWPLGQVAVLGYLILRWSCSIVLQEEIISPCLSCTHAIHIYWFSLPALI